MVSQMRDETPLLAMIVVMLVSLSIPIAKAQPPMPPCWFYGTVSVKGLPAQDNLNVTAAIIGTNLTWTTKTKNGTYGWTQMGSTSFYIPYDNLTTPNKDGGVDGDTIEFYLNGTKTNQTATFESLEMKRVDLTVGYPPDGNGNNVPIASFTESAETVLTGDVIIFNASASHDPDGSITGYFWDFGDGINATGVTTEHAYADDGVYAVTLTVTDNDGATASTTATKTVGNRSSTFNPYLLYVALAIVIGIGLVAVLWIRRKGYRRTRTTPKAE